MRFPRAFSLLLAVSLFGCNVPDSEVPTEAPDDDELAQLSGLIRSADPVHGQYIVVLRALGREGADPRAVAEIAPELAAAHEATMLHLYQDVLRGFAVQMSEAQAEAMSRHPAVQFVEEDGAVALDATQSPAEWGLDRVDQRTLPLTDSYTTSHSGAGVNVYVLDTGIRLSHAEFGGRAVFGADMVGDGRSGDDCNGHGTHVAGTIGGATYGLAKQTKLVAMRVLNCEGRGANSGIIAAVDWVRTRHVKPAVANLSLSGSASSALDAAVNSAAAAGVTMLVAAGNDNADACNYSPARATSAIAIGSTTSSDARSSFSNWGTCVDLFAPGSSVRSAWYTSNTATATLSGTSMATPHAAGVAALYLGAHPSAKTSEVRTALLTNATVGRVTSRGPNSPDRLLYAGFLEPESGYVHNGGFESSATPWRTSGTGATYTASGAYPHTGTGYIHIGNLNANGGWYQDVAIPATAPSATLGFWLNVISSDTSTTVHDRLMVYLRRADGTLIKTLASYSNLSRTTAGVYSYKGGFDLSAYRGQTIRLHFKGVTDGSLNTAFRIDDVSVK